MKQLIYVLLLLSSCARGQHLKDGLKECWESYLLRVNYCMNADEVRRKPDIVSNFDSLLFVAGAVLQSPLPEHKTPLTPNEFAIELTNFTNKTTLTFEKVYYCRSSSKEDVFFIHVLQRFHGDYLQDSKPIALVAQQVTLTVKQVNGQFLIASIQTSKAPFLAAQLADPDKDEIPSICDKCPHDVGSIEYRGAHPTEDCGCYTYEVIQPRWENDTQQIVVKPTCYVEVPATYETITETVMVKPESRRIIPVPATYETVTESFQTIPQSRKGAILETVTETVMVNSESKRIIAVPAQFTTVSEQIMVKSESKRVAANKENCLICEEEMIPAQYAVYTRQKLLAPATFREETIPAQYAPLTRQVVKREGSGEWIPAQYSTLTRRVVKSPATIKEETIPAEYKRITKQVVKTPAHCLAQIPADAYATFPKKKLIEPARYTTRAIPCEQATFQLKEVKVPAEYQDVSIRDAQNNVVGVKRVEICPAYTRYEVVQQ